jgi:hypothetical protein
MARSRCADMLKRAMVDSPQASFSMMPAFAVIRQHFDHALQFGFEAHESGNSRIDVI